jgi:hypothetical protein
VDSITCGTSGLGSIPIARSINAGDAVGLIGFYFRLAASRCAILEAVEARVFLLESGSTPTRLARIQDRAIWAASLVLRVLSGLVRTRATGITSFRLAFFLGKSLAFLLERELGLALIFLGCPFVQTIALKSLLYRVSLLRNVPSR